MHVASLENCQKLWKLSGWEYYQAKYRKNGFLVTWGYMKLMKGEAPAYSAGYLLRKLPKYLDDDYPKARRALNDFDDGWEASYVRQDEFHPPETLHGCTADTPEDALCRLAIKLFEEGVLR